MNQKMNQKMISRILGETISSDGAPQRKPFMKFPIALICSQSVDGECFARAIPLWTLLASAFDLSSRESMLNALIKAQALFSANGDPLGIDDADAFATASERRRVLVISCPDAILSREAIHRALSSISADLAPGPIVSLGNGESSVLAREPKLSENPEMAAYFEHLSEIGHSVEALGFGAAMSKVRSHASARAEAENLAELAFRLQEKRKFLPQHTGDKNPFLAISYSSNYSMHGVMSAMPMYAERTLVVPLPPRLVGQWAANTPKDQPEANALLGRIKLAVASALGQCLSEATPPVDFWQESATSLLDSLRIDCSNGRWVISGIAETGVFFARNGEELDRFMAAGGAALGNRISEDSISINFQWTSPWAELGKIGSAGNPHASTDLSDFSAIDRARLIALIEQADLSLASAAPSEQASRSKTL